MPVTCESEMIYGSAVEPIMCAKLWRYFFCLINDQFSKCDKVPPPPTHHFYFFALEIVSAYIDSCISTKHTGDFDHKLDNTYGYIYDVGIS